jgi:hypothetical protein
MAKQTNTVYLKTKDSVEHAVIYVDSSKVVLRSVKVLWQSHNFCWRKSEIIMIKLRFSKSVLALGELAN